VCGPCNQRAGVEIDQPWLDDYLVREARVRHQVPDRRGNAPRRLSIESGPSGGPPRAIVDLDGVDGTTTIRRIPTDEVEGDRITMTGYSKEALDKKIERLKRKYPSFEVVEEHEEVSVAGQVTVTSVQDPSRWPRFAAKTALASASLVAPDEWLDSEAAQGLIEVLWKGPPPDPTFEPGVAWCPVPYQLPNVFPLIRAPEHLLAFEPGGFVIIVFGELLYRIHGFEWEGLAAEPEISWPQSWWFSPDEPAGRPLPTQVQYGLLGMRFENR
jgi:hypothetical protein